MINIAIVEDEDQSADILNDYLAEYFTEKGEEYAIARFDEAVSFLSEYKAVYDIVFMDIELPDLNGMEAAEKMRINDTQTVLIFVTNMAQFAVKGYEVDALYFIVKPVKYPVFSRKLDKALNVIAKRVNATIDIMLNGVLTRLAIGDLRYVEIEKHTLRYHADNTVECWGTLKKVEEQLAPYSFLRCNNYCLVNPKFIVKVEEFEIKLNDGTVLQISRPRKQNFMKELAAYLGKGGKVFNG